jgi:quinol monooxygenase YgiN
MAAEQCGVVELRRYALHPGSREALIELFERALVEPQEAAGMQVLGQFRDLDDPDAFVWLRGFRDMATRARALGAFYGGPVWREHRDAANATMIDSDNVLLLRPLEPPAGIRLDPRRRLPPGAAAVPPGLVVATICPLAVSAAAAFADFFARDVEPMLRDGGADVVATFATERSPNNFPALPVREGEEVFVWLASFADQAAHAEHVDRIDVAATLAGRTDGPPETWRLTPTARSLLRGPPYS